MRKKEEKDTATSSSSRSRHDDELEEKKKEKKKASLYKLFAFADGFDVAMMVVGATAAVANGMAQPLMTFIFGDVIDAFGAGSAHNVLHRVTKACMHVLSFSYFIYSFNRCKLIRLKLIPKLK